MTHHRRSFAVACCAMAAIACALTPAMARAATSPPALSAFFAQDATTPGADVGIGFTVVNTDATTTLTGVGFSVALPAGLVISTPSQLATTCDGTVTAADGGTTISLAGATLQPSGSETGASCDVLLDVVAAAAGAVLVAPGSATSSESGPGSPGASASLLVLATPTMSESFDKSSIRVGEMARVTFTITNPNATTRLYNLAFDDALPGVAVAAPANVVTTCPAEVLAAPGATAISLIGLQVEGGAQCSLSLDVIGTSATISPNPTGPLSFSYDAGGGDLRAATAPGATDTLVVHAPPTLTLAFGASIAPGASTTLTFTLANTNPALALSGIGFTDALPAGLVVATPNGLGGSCGAGTITAAAGSGSIALAGAALAPLAACTFSVAGSALTAGAKANTTSAVSSVEAGPGPAATAALLVAAPPAIGLGPGTTVQPPPPPPPPAARLPSNRFKVTKFRVTRGGTARFDVTVAGAGDVLVLATLGTSTLRVRKPGPGRFTVARKTVHAKRAGTLHISVRPNARGRIAIRRARTLQRLNVWTAFRPTGGRAGTAVLKTGVLRPR
jgi:hypothetical protein